MKGQVFFASLVATLLGTASCYPYANAPASWTQPVQTSSYGYVECGRNQYCAFPSLERSWGTNIACVPTGTSTQGTTYYGNRVQDTPENDGQACVYPISGETARSTFNCNWNDEPFKHFKTGDRPKTDLNRCCHPNEDCLFADNPYNPNQYLCQAKGYPPPAGYQVGTPQDLASNKCGKWPM